MLCSTSLLIIYDVFIVFVRNKSARDSHIGRVGDVVYVFTAKHLFICQMRAQSVS